jgi:hypothetical protein
MYTSHCSTGMCDSLFLSLELHMSIGTVHGIIWGLGYHKVCSRWVLHLLQDIQKKHHMSTALGICSATMLRVICLCSRMVGDKTCSNLCTHGKTRKHAMETLHFTLDKEICMSQAYADKVMLTVLFNSEGPLLVEIT